MLAYLASPTVLARDGRPLARGGLLRVGHGWLLGVALWWVHLVGRGQHRTVLVGMWGLHRRHRAWGLIHRRQRLLRRIHVSMFGGEGGVDGRHDG